MVVGDVGGGGGVEQLSFNLSCLVQLPLALCVCV